MCVDLTCVCDMIKMCNKVGHVCLCHEYVIGMCERWMMCVGMWHQCLWGLCVCGPDCAQAII